MPNTIGEAWVAIRPDTTGFASELSSGLGGAFAKAAVAIAAVVGAFDAVKGVVGASVSAFGEQQVATVLLNQAMKDTSEKWTPALSKALAATEAKMLTFGDTTASVEGALQTLILRGVPAGQAMSDLSEIANIAAATNMSLADATDLVTKAASGRLSPILKELGATTLPKGVTGVKALNDILAEVAPKVVGAADAVSHTMPGAFAVFGATIHEKVLVPIGDFINKGLVIVERWISAHSRDISNVLAGAVAFLGTAFKDIYTVVTTFVLPVLGDLWSYFNKNILPIIQSVANWFTQHFVPALTGLWQSLNQHVFPALKPVVDLFGTATSGFLWAVTTVGEFIVNTFLGALKTMSDHFGTIETPLAGIVASFVIWKGVAVGGAIVTMLQGMVAAIPGLLAFGAASIVALWPWLAIAAAAAAVLEVIHAITSITATKAQAASALHNAGLNRGTGVFNPPTIPPRAAGGPVTAGMGYMVGEQGPEFFRPSVSGTIIPHGATGGLTQNNFFYGVGKETVELVDERIQRNNRALILAKRAH